MEGLDKMQGGVMVLIFQTQMVIMQFVFVRRMMEQGVGVQEALYS
jgi:hypothetical protein